MDRLMLLLKKARADRAPQAKRFAGRSANRVRHGINLKTTKLLGFEFRRRYCCAPTKSLMTGLGQIGHSAMSANVRFAQKRTGLGDL